jgi:hypothetical protein
MLCEFEICSTVSRLNYLNITQEFKNVSPCFGLKSFLYEQYAGAPPPPPPPAGRAARGGGRTPGGGVCGGLGG